MTGFDPRTAKITGELHLKESRLPLAPELGTLRDANIDVAIHPHDIAVKTTGKLGAGDIKLDGTIALDGASLTGGQATITLRKVSPIGTIEPVIDADVAAKLARKDGAWHADLVVDHGFVKVTTTSGEKLKPVGAPSDLTIGRGKPPAKREDHRRRPPSSRSSSRRSRCTTRPSSPPSFAPRSAARSPRPPTRTRSA